MTNKNGNGYVTPMFIAHGEHNAEVLAWEQGIYDWTEQYQGKKVRAQFSRDRQCVRLVLTNSKGTPIDERSQIISAQQWADRPKAGQGKAEARWAFSMLDILASKPE
tara:strand:+ start:7064 stop:7384 length:321 start_codon:yes stop_codon:yes gene_type:complete